jgi:hypothetical protein
MKPKLAKFAEYWHQFWFVDGSPLNLAMARIVFATTSLWVLISRNFAGISGLPVEFWSAVPAATNWRYLLFHGHPILENSLEWVAGIALVAATLGLWAQFSCFVGGVLLYHLAPLETIIWTPNPYARGLTTAVLALLTLSCSPCGDRLAVRFKHKTRLLSRDPGDYAWPLRLIQVFIVQIYVFSGYAKLFHSSWKWASAANLRNWMLYFSQEDQVRVFHSLGAWIAQHPVVCQLIAVGTLLFELGFVTVLFVPTARRVLVPMAAVFHAVILFSMNLVFLNVPQLLVFANWDRLGSSLARIDRHDGESRVQKEKQLTEKT